MGMWLIPALIAMIIICVISFVSTLKIAKMTSERKSEKDTPISETVEEYATMLNPIVWVYLIFFTLFRDHDFFITGVRLAIRNNASSIRDETL
ncbi:short-chain dehydrogenase [Lysinibacillus sp. MHQ-1]|nr:short-chain dehydrogenase [Lysinibacillus sp. MHQ-1]